MGEIIAGKGILVHFVISKMRGKMSLLGHFSHRKMKEKYEW